MKVLRGLGVLLVPPCLGVAGFAVLTIVTGELPYSGLPGTDWLADRRVLNAHIVPLLVAVSLLALHLAAGLGVVIRTRTGRGTHRAPWSVLATLVLGFVLAVELGLLQTPVAEWPLELPVAAVTLGLPALAMLGTTECLAFDRRAASIQPAGAI